MAFDTFCATGYDHSKLIYAAMLSRDRTDRQGQHWGECAGSNTRYRSQKFRRLINTVSWGGPELWMRESSRSCCGRRSTPRSKRRRRDSSIRYAWKITGATVIASENVLPDSRQGGESGGRGSARGPTGTCGLHIMSYPRAEGNRWEDTSSSRMYLSPLESLLGQIFFFFFFELQFSESEYSVANERNWRDHEGDDSCLFRSRNIRVWDELRLVRFRRMMPRPVFSFISLSICSRAKTIISRAFYPLEHGINFS